MHFAVTFFLVFLINSSTVSRSILKFYIINFFSAICRSSCGDGRCIRPNLCYCGNRQVGPTCDGSGSIIPPGGGGLLPGGGIGPGGGIVPGGGLPGGEGEGAESVIIPGGGGGGVGPGGGVLPPQRSKKWIS